MREKKKPYKHLMTFCANLFFLLHLNLSSVSGGKFALCIFLSKTMLLNISLLIMVRSIFVSVLFLFFLLILVPFCIQNQFVLFSLHFLNIRFGLFQVFTWFVAFTLFIKSHFYHPNWELFFFTQPKTYVHMYICTLACSDRRRKNVYFLNCER